MQKSVKHLRVDQGAVLLIDKQEEDAPMRTMIRRVQTDIRTIPYRLGGSDHRLDAQEPAAAGGQRFRHRRAFPASRRSRADVRSLLCVPLRLKGRMIGVLSVFNKHGGEGFSEDDSACWRSSARNRRR